MKVILKSAVPKLGKEGQVVNVKDGYARNYLFPNSMAILADKKQLEVQARRHAKVALALAETKSAAEAKKAEIDGKTVTLPAKVGGDGGKLFGAITSQDIADALKSQLGLEVEKKQVLLSNPIKKLGKELVEIDIHPQVDIKVWVHVYDAEHPESLKEEAVEEVAAEAVPVEA